MKKYPILLIILLIPIIYAQDCNTKCIEEGYSSGSCTTKCMNQVEITGATDCTRRGDAVLVIGSESINTYENNDPFIGQNDTNPEYIWISQNLKTKAATNIFNTSDDTAHSGPLLGIKNNFVATDIDEIGIKAIAKGESLCLPDNIICIKFNGLTVSDYATYVIQKTTVDLSSSNSSWNNKPTILIHSTTDANGLKLQTSSYDSIAPNTDGVTTDKIWIIYNNTIAYAAVYYEDSTNAKKLAGYINIDNPNDDINIADINYKKTLDNNIQIDLRGNFSVANNLDLVLDILAEEGSAGTDGNDDITVNLKHNANGDFDGFGATASLAEEADLVWVSTNIGTKDEDHRSLYGIIIKDPKSNNALDKFEFQVPADQVKAEIEITRTPSAITKIKRAGTTVLGKQIPSPILASEINIREDYNIIYIGGPCANPILEEFKDFPKCKDWPLQKGEAMIKYVKNGNNIALLIAGTTAEDTKMATEFMENFQNYKLQGTYIKIKNKKPEVIIASLEGIDFSDYPYPFIKEGKIQNMLLVVGDNALADDTIGAQDIASSLFLITRRSSEFSNETKTLDSNETTIKKIALGNKLSDRPFFNPLISYTDVKNLLKGENTIGGNKFNYKEIIMLYKGGPSIETSLSSSDDTYKSNVYMEATSGSIRYYYSFEDTVDLTLATAKSPLTINVLENDLAITEIETATKFKSQTAKEYYMKSGSSVTVESKQVYLVGIGKDSIIVRTNNTELIIPNAKLRFINGLKIKNIDTFSEAGSTCCCTDLLSNLL